MHAAVTGTPRRWLLDRVAGLAPLLAPAPLGFALVFGVTFLAYTTRLLTGIGFWDTGIFQGAAATLGMTHPTGYPSYVILGHLFQLLVPLAPAHAMTLFSALCTAFACAGTFLIAVRLGASWIVAIAAALLLGLSLDLFRTATRADAHSLHALAVVVLVGLVLEWSRAPHEKRRLVPLVGLIFGLSLGNHLMTLMLLPALGLVLIARDRAALLQPRRLALLAGAVASGASVYLYLPLRSAMDPPIRYSTAPDTWETFWWYVSGAQFRGDMSFLSLAGLEKAIGRLPAFAESMATALGTVAAAVLLVAAVVGLVRLAAVDRGVALFLAAAALIPLYVGLTYENAHLERYYFATLIVASALGAVGATAVLAWLRRRLGSARPLVPIAAASLLLAPYHAFSSNAPSVPDASAECYARTILAAVEPDSTVIAWWDHVTPLWYLQAVEHVRPDVEVIGAIWTAPAEAAARAGSTSAIYLVQPSDVVERTEARLDVAATPIEMCGVRVSRLALAE